MIPRHVQKQKSGLLGPGVPCPTRGREAEDRLLQVTFKEQQKNSTTIRQLLPAIISSYTGTEPPATEESFRSIKGLSNHSFLPSKFGHVQHLSVLCCHADGDCPGRCVRKNPCAALGVRDFTLPLLLQTLALNPATQSATHLRTPALVYLLANASISWPSICLWLDEPEHSTGHPSSALGTGHFQPAFLEQQLGVYMRGLLSSCSATGSLGLGEAPSLSRAQWVSAQEQRKTTAELRPGHRSTGFTKWTYLSQIPDSIFQ